MCVCVRGASTTHTHTKRYTAASPQTTFTILKTLGLQIQSLQQGTYELPEDDLKRSKHVGAFLSVLILTF